MKTHAFKWLFKKKPQQVTLIYNWCMYSFQIWERMIQGERIYSVLHIQDRIRMGRLTFTARGEYKLWGGGEISTKHLRLKQWNSGLNCINWMLWFLEAANEFGNSSGFDTREVFPLVQWRTDWSVEVGVQQHVSTSDWKKLHPKLYCLCLISSSGTR